MKFTYSLIIPHYNIPDLLRRLLQTVPQREDLQVILVDDCSTKNLDALARLKNDFEWVEWYTTGTNGGGGKARNIGLKYAKGEYVFFADSDDFFDRSLNNLLNEHYKEDIIFFNAQGIYEDSGSKSDRTQHLQSYIDEYELNDKNGELSLRFLFGEPWCRLINRKVILDNEIKFDETYIHNDTLFSYKLGYHAKNIRVYNQILYYVSDRQYSVSKIINWNNLKIRTQIFAEKNKFLIDNKIPIFDQILLSPLIIYIKNWNYKKIKEYYGIIRKNNLSIFLILSKLISKIITYYKE